MTSNDTIKKVEAGEFVAIGHKVFFKIEGPRYLDFLEINKFVAEPCAIAVKVARLLNEADKL